jgi:hypothetical protein
MDQAVVKGRLRISKDLTAGHSYLVTEVTGSPRPRYFRLQERRKVKRRGEAVHPTSCWEPNAHESKSTPIWTIRTARFSIYVGCQEAELTIESGRSRARWARGWRGSLAPPLILGPRTSPQRSLQSQKPWMIAVSSFWMANPPPSKTMARLWTLKRSAPEEWRDFAVSVGKSARFLLGIPVPPRKQ